MISSNWKSQKKVLVKAVKRTGKTCTSLKMFLASSDLKRPKSGPPSIRSPYLGQDLSNGTLPMSLNYREPRIQHFRHLSFVYKDTRVDKEHPNALNYPCRLLCGHSRADEAGPSLARDVEEASAGNERAQSSIPTFFKRRKYHIHDSTSCI